MKHLLVLFHLALPFLEALSQEQQLRRSECGGTLKADTNSLSYPGVAGESLIPGETCVWTIHLETTRDFRINFTQFDVNGSNSSCVNGAVRLYSLSNLVPADRFEGFSFCSANSPPDYFYLGGNVAVLVVTSSSSNSRPGSGFKISWEGNAYDQLQTKHVATFSSSETGAISYPGVGNYASSLAATWLISKESSTSASTDVQLSQLQLESCSNPDPCTCDALLIYEMNLNGNLREVTRYCSNVTSPITTSALSSSFVLAFFTDFNAAPTGASGFSVLYFPVEGSTTTPTTEPTTTPAPEPTTTPWTYPTTTPVPEPTTTPWTYPTTTPVPEPTTTPWTYPTTTPVPEPTTTPWTHPTTTPVPEPTTTPWTYPTTTPVPEPTTTEQWETTTQQFAECGETITRWTGEIKYKPNSLYDPNERCVWVIAPTEAAEFLVYLNYTNNDARDGVTISTIDRSNPGILDPGRPEGVGLRRLYGNILIVTFYSNSVDQYTGFRLEYWSYTNLRGPEPSSVIVSSALQWPAGVDIKYPAGNDPYENNALATFVFSPNFRLDNRYFNYAHVKDVSMEECGCCDAIYVYEFSPFFNKWEKYPNFTICGGAIKEHEINSADMILFVFQSDPSQGRDGFTVDFSVKPY